MKSSPSPVSTPCVAFITRRSQWFALAAMVVLAGVPAALAATDTWNGASSTSALWSDPLNWVGSVTPGTNDSLVFDGAVQLNNTNDLTANAPLGGLTFNPTAGAFVLNGNAIAPTNNSAVWIADNAAVPEVINLNIAPPTNIVFSVAAGGNLTNSGVISGSRNMSQTNSGTLTLTGTNTFTGPISGIVGTLVVGGAGQLNKGVYAGTIANAGTFAYNSSAIQTNSGIMSGAGKLVVNGPGTLTLAALNTFSGSSTVNGGVLQLNAGGAAGAIFNVLTINPGATVNALTTDALGYTTGTCVTNITISGGTFNIGLNGNEGFFATLNLMGGTFSSTGGGGFNTSNNVVNDSINTFATNIVSTISAPVVLRGFNLTYTVAAGTVPNGIDLVASGVHSISGGNGVLVKAGPGAMAMTAVNTFNGGLIVSNGTFNVNGGGSLNSGNFGGFITNLAIINFNITNSQTISGAIYGTGAISNNASGTLSFSGASPFSGATMINAGRFIGITGGSISNSPLTIAAGATNGVQLAGFGGQFTSTNLTFGAGAYMDFNFNNIVLSAGTPPWIVNGNLTLGGALNVIVRNTVGVVPGTYQLIKYSGTLSGTPPTTPISLPTGIVATLVNNTANKSIDLSITTGNQIDWATGSGTWDFSTPNWKNGASPVDYADGNYVLFEDTQSGASPINVTLNTTVQPVNATFNDSSKNYNLSGSGAIAGAATFTKEGTGTLTLAINNTYTNATTLAAGTTVLNFTGSAANNIIPTNSTVVFAGGTLNVLGNISGSSSQIFTNTTFNNGSTVITVTNNATLALGAMTEALGGVVMFNGPATDIGVTGSSIPVPATGTITTTTAGAGYTDNLISGSSTTSGYATVGLYDWAATSGGTIVGGSQISGFYSVGTANATVNNDLTVSLTGPSSTASGQSMRFNTPATITLTTRSVIDGAGILVTPNVGANNIIFNTSGSTHQWSANRNGANRAPVTWQNNTLGLLMFGIAIADTGTAPDQYVQAGPGTVVYTADGIYTGQTYLNGGVSVITDPAIFGATSGNQIIYLSGGTVMATNTMTMDGGATAKRPFVLGFGGGGLAAPTAKVFTVDGVISGTPGSGPLWIGIPASSANGNVSGLLPGTGSGTANPTPVHGQRHGESDGSQHLHRRHDSLQRRFELHSRNTGIRRNHAQRRHAAMDRRQHH